jgi:hypothetical protein
MRCLEAVAEVVEEVVEVVEEEVHAQEAVLGLPGNFKFCVLYTLLPPVLLFLLGR